MGKSVKVRVDALRAALKAVDAVVEKRSTITVLSHVMIRTTPGQMMLTGTDLDLMMERQIDLEDPGSNAAMAFCAPASLLRAIAGKLPADAVAVIAAEKAGAISLSCGSTGYRLPTLPVDDFPVMAAADWAAQWEQPGDDLATAIGSVRYAISTEEVRYYLNGIYWHARHDGGDGEARHAMAATDGSRLALHRGDAPEGAAAMSGIIIPRKAVAAILLMMDMEGGAVDVAVSATRFRFAVGASVLTGKAVDGTFPDYDRVVPTANRFTAWFDPAALIEAVERVLTISSEKTRLLAVDFGKAAMVLRVVSPENGTASEDVPCDYDGEPMTVGFNGRYLIDLLAQLKGREGVRASVALADPAAPTLWRQSDDGARLHVLMPMRV